MRWLPHHKYLASSPHLQDLVSTLPVCGSNTVTLLAYRWIRWPPLLWELEGITSLIPRLFLVEERWREVFHCLAAANLHVKLQKCQFGCIKARYLGHSIGQGEIEPDVDKVIAVRDYPRPIVKKDVRAFLGLVGYYQCFIPQFAAIAIPLTTLVKKNKPDTVVWDQSCTEAFQSLKDAPLRKPILSVANPAKPFILQTDTSHYGLGAVLSQEGQDGCEHPVAYASRKLLPREVKYAVIEKECLAIVWALKVFHVYLHGQAFTVETDHQPLSWLHRTRNANARLTH